MKFPGRRKSKHYFPVNESGRVSFGDDNIHDSVYIVGIDQLLVDIEIEVDDEFLSSRDIKKGESVILDDEMVEDIYLYAKENNMIKGEFAGGAVGNTLHNYSVLSDGRSVALGAICESIKVGDYAFNYISNTSSKVDFRYLEPCKGHMGRAMCFITPDKERTFGIGKGIMNELRAESIPEDVIKDSSALLITAFLLRDEKNNIFKATLKAVEYAKKHDVPVVFALGTSSVIEGKKDFFKRFIKENVNVLAMNSDEAKALIDIEDPLLAGQEILNMCDLSLITHGDRGLYVCGWVDEHLKRETRDLIHSKSISEYNLYEYSRAQKKSQCKSPIKIFTHINPFMGGPIKIENTNGAGDAALSALLHDMSANIYHKSQVPNSPKHEGVYLTYSSIHQICKYANRCSYEVLKQKSPRLLRGLPVKEESLEESYWSL